MRLRQATDGDLAAIMALEEDGFEATERWSVASWEAETGRDLRTVLVHEGAPGFPVDAVACFGVLDDTAELLRIAVAQPARGQGLGAELVIAAQQWARDQGAARMLLEVRHDNEPALAVYRATGFGEIARRNDYYGTGRHAVVMECQL